MRKLIGTVGLVAAALLAGCGGGGGSPGESHTGYEITLRADRTSLPLNIQNQGPGIGASAPYTTTLYVNATEGGQAIPNGADNVFSCQVAAGLGSGPLYYLDGKDEHMTDVPDGNGGTVKVPTAYRSITLGANAGGASFHFHAGDQSGTSRVTCSVTDPRDKRQYSASVDITVGGATGKPASILFRALAPGYLGSRYNVNNIRNNVTLQAVVRDDANQLVPNPTAANVRVRIVGVGDAATGARLVLGNQSGDVVQAQTEGGVALFSLSSGPARGVLLLELTADRRDNDVTNGVQDPVTQLLAVSVVDGLSGQPLVVAPVSLAVTGNVSFAQALEATGGTPPYSWTALDPLPYGLMLAPSGIISGITSARSGVYVVRVRATDAYGATADAPVTLTITQTPITITTASVVGNVGTPLSYTLAASGGIDPYTWAAAGAMPPGLSLGSGGVIGGTPTVAGNYTVAVRVTDGAGSTMAANISISISATQIPTITMDAASLAAITGVKYSYVLTASGGIRPYQWVAMGAMPPGLTLSSAGVVSGTPTTAGEYPVAVRVTDNAGSQVTGNITIKVAAPITIGDTTSTAMTLVERQLFSSVLSASGGFAPYTWEVLGAAPSWLAVSPGGVVSGTPPVGSAGEYLVALRVTDSAGITALTNLKITVKAGSTVTIDNPPALSLVEMKVFSSVLSASGGLLPYAWDIQGPAPSWLTISAGGVLSGTPPVGSAGVYLVAVRVTDGGGATALANLKITVTSGPSLTITPASLTAMTGVAYSYVLTASGGVAPYSWAALGAMPAGLTLGSDGLVNGTPTAAGDYTVAVKVTDNTGVSATGSVAIKIAAAMVIGGAMGTSFSVDAQKPFSFALAVTGGVGPYTWQSIGPAPGWLSLSSVGVISGVPPLGAVGGYVIAVQVTDSTGKVTAGNISITVTGP